jgi:hypothetical protein
MLSLNYESFGGSTRGSIIQLIAKDDQDYYIIGKHPYYNYMATNKESYIKTNNISPYKY